VIGAKSEDPSLGILGTVLFGRTSEAEMLLFELEYADSQIGARTLIVQLKAPIPVGSPVSGKTHLLPEE
jgi:hypothetical protein